MTKDLLKHLDDLEAFGSRFVAAPEPKKIGYDWNLEPDKASPESSAAEDFLERIGALPKAVYPRESSLAPNDGSTFRLNSIDEKQLESVLCKLPSMEALLDLLQEGVRCGAVRLSGDRVMVSAQSSSSGPESSNSSYEITSVVRRASSAIKAREAAPLLAAMAENQANGVRGQSSHRESVPAFVQLRQQRGRGLPTLREGAIGRKDSLRQRIRELVSRHPVIASLDEVGEDTVLMVRGGPVRLADGSYLPVEAVQQEARAGLADLMRRRGSGHGTLFAKVDELEPAEIPEEYLSRPDIEAGLEESDVPSPARIELAYRLLKGIQLSPDEGEPLDVSTRARFEKLLGHGFSHVKLHTGPAAEWITQSLSARAVTAGEHIFLPRSQLQEGARGEQTLAHELTHVRQAEAQTGDRPRAELEAEARAAESAIDAAGELAQPETGSVMPWASKVVPRLPQPGRLEPQGVFMAERDTRTASTGPGIRPQLDLRNEEVLEKIEAQIRESEAREKEEARDRVF